MKAVHWSGIESLIEINIVALLMATKIDKNSLQKIDSV